MQDFTGVFPVLHTPFRDDESIDDDSLQAEIEFVLDHGADGLTIALASEVLRLTAEERTGLVRRTIELASGRCPVVASVGGESTAQAVTFARNAADAGAAAFMAIPPLATAAEESELRGYFGSILDAADLPLIIQDASGYVGKPMSVAFQVQLFLDFGDRILFKPEANPVGPLISALHAATDGKARLFEGNGGLSLVDNHARGVTGSMPGSDVIWAIVKLWKALVDGDEELTRRIQLPLTSLVLAMAGSLDAFVSLEKHLLVKQGVIASARVRGPVAYRPDAQALGELELCFDELRRACQP